MGYLKYVRKLWEKPQKNMTALMKQRLLQWRKEPATVRLAKPTRIDRARSLGYKAKQGFVVVRQRVQRSRRMRPSDIGGRRPKHQRRKMVLSQTYRSIAEQRAQKKFPNCEVLSSYPLTQDGKFNWFEIILVDKHHPQIKAGKQTKWITKKQHQGRVFRGLTAAAKKTRGLYKRGKGAEKLRPGQRGKKRMAK